MRSGPYLPLALALVLTTAAAAQPASPATEPLPAGLRKVEDGTRIVARWNLTVDQIEHRKIHGPDGQLIAEVDRVLEDSSGTVRALVAEFGGIGFGIFDTEVIVTLDQLTPEGDQLTTRLTQEQFSALPAAND